MGNGTDYGTTTVSMGVQSARFNNNLTDLVDKPIQFAYEHGRRTFELELSIDRELLQW